MAVLSHSSVPCPCHLRNMSVYVIFVLESNLNTDGILSLVQQTCFHPHQFVVGQSGRIFNSANRKHSSMLLFYWSIWTFKLVACFIEQQTMTYLSLCPPIFALTNKNNSLLIELVIFTYFYSKSVVLVRFTRQLLWKRGTLASLESMIQRFTLLYTQSFDIVI